MYGPIRCINARSSVRERARIKKEKKKKKKKKKKEKKGMGWRIFFFFFFLISSDKLFNWSVIEKGVGENDRFGARIHLRWDERPYESNRPLIRGAQISMKIRDPISIVISSRNSRVPSDRISVRRVRVIGDSTWES